MPTDPTGFISHEDELHRSQTWKRVVRCATTANVTFSTGFAAGQVIDGMTLATGDRILIKDQSSAALNGIYTVNASGFPTRAYDFDQDPVSDVPAHEVAGAMVFVLSGTVNAGTLWHCTNTGSPVLNTNPITFAQFTSGGTTTTQHTFPFFMG